MFPCHYIFFKVSFFHDCLALSSPRALQGTPAASRRIEMRGRRSRWKEQGQNGSAALTGGTAALPPGQGGPAPRTHSLEHRPSHPAQRFYSARWDGAPSGFLGSDLEFPKEMARRVLPPWGPLGGGKAAVCGNVGISGLSAGAGFPALPVPAPLAKGPEPPSLEKDRWVDGVSGGCCMQLMNCSILPLKLMIHSMLPKLNLNKKF